jgi:hypothetical protein
MFARFSASSVVRSKLESLIPSEQIQVAGQSIFRCESHGFALYDPTELYLRSAPLSCLQDRLKTIMSPNGPALAIHVSMRLCASERHNFRSIQDIRTTVLHFL